MIPKIIFQTAPKDIERWKDVWPKCRESWKIIFPEPEWKHILWNDDDNERFIETEYPDYYDMYMSYDRIIKRVDIVRYFFLHKYGGIYADMDYMVLSNFYNLLPTNKVSVCESPFKKWEKVQNSLMASNPGNPFWMKLIQKARNRINEGDVLKSTGPILLGDTLDENVGLVNILPVDIFNPRSGTPGFNSPDVKTKHYGTCSWNYPVKSGMTDDKKINEIILLYNDVLERDPDPEGLSFYYYSGRTIEGIKKDLLSSGEYKRLNRSKEIKILYNEWLKRDPDEDGMNFYLNSGKSIMNIRNDLASSGERINVMKIKIISAYTENDPYKSTSDITFPTIEKYCESNGFSCERFDITDSKIHPYFMKIPLIMEGLKEFDYVVWMDTDSFILNQKYDLKKLLSSGKNLYISEDHNGINCGVMIWRKCGFSQRILQRIMDLYEEFKNHPWGDQAALAHIIDENELLIREKMEIVDQNILNSYDYHKLYNVDRKIGQFSYDSFIIHFPGIPSKEKVIRKYVEFLFDNE